MALVTVAGTPGLWRDPDWQPGMPGLYALLVGISAYPHLEGGTAPAPDAFGLGQLGASAHTAAALFDWLRQDFRHAGLPLVWCQLLLAPSPEEHQRLLALGLQHYGVPDHANLVKAIQRWTGQLPSAPAAARHSRSLFFFSGHGVQSNWRALLLPSDYLDPEPGAPQLQNCISTRELQDWMEQCPVAEHLALIDACRNEFSPLAARGASAHSCFPLLPASTEVARTAASLAATSPGMQAYQAPGQPYTLFGQAVLEAVRGLGGGDAQLELRELIDYVKPRVNALLQQAGGHALEQTVRPRIEGDDTMVVTALPAASAPNQRPRVGVVARPRAGASASAPGRPNATSRFEPALAVHETIAFEHLRQDHAAMHRRMGHEYISYLWHDGVQLLDLVDGRSVADGMTVHAVERDEAHGEVQVDLGLPACDDGVLLVFEGANFVQRERLAVALPTDPGAPVTIRLNLQFAPPPTGGPPLLQKLQARLGPLAQPPQHDTLVALLREAERGSLRQAAARIDPQWLRKTAQDPARGRSAATAGMLLLARAGQTTALHDGARLLRRAHPSWPDGAVLWAEALRQAMAHGQTPPAGATPTQSALVDALSSLHHTGLPYFTDALELADGLLRHALRWPLPAAQREPLLAVRDAIARLQDVAQPDGDFPVLAGLPRPASCPGSGPLGSAEMRALLGRSLRAAGAGP
jgi:hypothetical protein